MCTGAEAIIISSVIGAGTAIATKPKAAKAAPKAAPPVKREDPNVQQAADRKKRQMAAASRAASRTLVTPGSTLG